MARQTYGAWVIVAAVAIGLAAPASAQDNDRDDEQEQAATQTLEVAEPEATSGQVVTTTTTQPIGPPYWASIGGFSMDSHEAGYGFFGPQYIHPLRPSVAFIGAANLNYLFYAFDTFDGRQDVQSPGVNAMGGLMFGNRNWFAVMAGPSFRRRHITVFDPANNVIRSDRDLHVGFNIMTSLWVDPTPHNNVFTMYNYDTVDNYHWGRVAFKEMVANRGWQGDWTPFLGVEYTAQGNENILSQQFGPFFELAHGPSRVSVMVGGGYKHSAFDLGPDQTGPWFAIGFYHRVR